MGQGDLRDNKTHIYTHTLWGHMAHPNPLFLSLSLPEVRKNSGKWRRGCRKDMEAHPKLLLASKPA